MTVRQLAFHGGGVSEIAGKLPFHGSFVGQTRTASLLLGQGNVDKAPLQL
jgi:hypothetical protein